MPLINIKDVPALSVEIRCVHCASVSEHLIASLKLGTSARDANGILFPPCSCGAQEMLVRTFDGDDDERSRHRKAVNAVAAFLKSAGLVHPDAAEAVKADTRVPKLIRPLVGPV